MTHMLKLKQKIQTRETQRIHKNETDLLQKMKDETLFHSFTFKTLL